MVQVILVLFALLMVLLIARQRPTAISAIKKVGLVLLGIVMIISVLMPQLTTVAANALGIGRGADLLLYGLTATFIVYALTQYSRSQAHRRIVFDLARRVTILDATTRYAKRLADRDDD